MIPKRFEDVEFSDLEALLDNQVAEGKMIEYKKELVTNASSDKDPFLAGVSAFANTVGGDFIIGIEAKDGIPINLSGANFTNADAEILKLEQILQSGLEPRLPSVNVKDIQSPKGENFILVRVNKSWIAPHKVKANEKFYGRNSKGKYPLDVSELRTAFMLSEQITDRIRNFRLERVRKIKQQDELPVELADGAKLILHLVPLSAFISSFEINLQELEENPNNLLKLSISSANRFINLDGIVSYSRNAENKSYDYAQLFRNGSLESIHVFGTHNNEKFLPSTSCERILIKCINDHRELLSYMGIEFPLTIFVSLIDVKDYEFEISGNIWGFEKRKSDRNNLFFPEQIISRKEDESVTILRPIFDKLWNAFGLGRSYNYNENGEWKPR